MVATEVSNLEYREFLLHLRQTGQEPASLGVDVRSDGWVIADRQESTEPMQKHYFNHPAFDAFPVVNVSREGAERYCAYLKDRLNNSGALRAGYEVKSCRLPTRDEWMAAAQGGRNSAPYPWGGYYVRNAKGCLLANFNPIGTESVTYDSETDTYRIVDVGRHHNLRSSMFTAKVDAYHPNDYGLYNMSGNVAEMIAEDGIAVGGGWNSTGYDIRIESTMPFAEFSRDVGFRPLLVVGPK